MWQYPIVVGKTLPDCRDPVYMLTASYIMSQRTYLRLKMTDQNTKKKTIWNPGVKGLKIRYLKIKTSDPSLCLLDAIY